MKINRKLTIKQLLNRLPFENKYFNDEIVCSLKNEGPEEVEIEFFKLNKFASNQEVLDEFEKRRLVADAGALITLMLEQPDVLKEKKYIGLQLKDDTFLAFEVWAGERIVYCSRFDGGWRGGWVFGGVRKSLDSKSLDSSILGLLEEIEKLVKEVKSKIK